MEAKVVMEATEEKAEKEAVAEKAGLESGTHLPTRLSGKAMWRSTPDSLHSTPMIRQNRCNDYALQFPPKVCRICKLVVTGKR
jgi:hypothetical protein